MKNMDPLNDNVVDLLKASNDSFTRDIWEDGKSQALFLYQQRKTRKRLTIFSGNRKSISNTTIGYDINYKIKCEERHV